MVDPKIPPTKPGLYLVKRNEDMKQYDLVVNISGKTPFLRLTVWDRADNTITEVVAPHENWVWCVRMSE